MTELEFKPPQLDSLKKLHVLTFNEPHDTALFRNISAFKNLRLLHINSHPRNADLLDLPNLEFLFWHVDTAETLIVSESTTWQESLRRLPIIEPEILEALQAEGAIVRL